MASNNPYPKKPVYQVVTPRGFHHNYFIMFHATDKNNVESILKNGFTTSINKRGHMLGDGVYCSLNFDKAYPVYGNVVFKLLIYVGKTYKCTRQDDPLRCAWQNDYSSAWCPPNSTDLNPSRKEENCIKSPNQIKILGLYKGFDLVPAHVQRMTRNKENSDCDTLSPDEQVELENLKQEMLRAGRQNLVQSSSQKTTKTSSGGKPSCKYGSNCYRKNPDHLQKFSHPVDDSDNETLESD